MDSTVKILVNKHALALCSIIILIALGFGFLISLAYGVAVTIALRLMYGDAVKAAIDAGLISRTEFQYHLIKSRYFWLGIGVAIIVSILKVMFS